MSYIRELKSGKSQIIKDVAFCIFLNGQLPPYDFELTELIKDFDNRIGIRDGSVTGGALSNAHGDWYEWLLAITAWNFCAENESANLILLTPNIKQFDISRLYNDRLFSLIQDLRHKVLASSFVQLISSNPDFVIIDRRIVNEAFGLIEKITIIDKNAIELIENAFRQIVGKCDFEDIHGYVSVKFSFRPDRRLQIPHEGSLMKAIYTHLQTREWIINPKGIKYFAISAKVNDSDRAALKTVATHSITTVHSLPQAAVDNVFKVNTLQEANDVFSQIL